MKLTDLNLNYDALNRIVSAYKIKNSVIYIRIYIYIYSSTKKEMMYTDLEFEYLLTHHLDANKLSIDLSDARFSETLAKASSRIDVKGFYKELIQ